MINSTEEMQQQFREKFIKLYGKNLDEGTDFEYYMTLANLLKEIVTSNLVHTKNFFRKHEHKQVYYFSMEFLPGRLLGAYLQYLGMKCFAEEGLKALGIDLLNLEAQEPDLGLGNGGLGRLGACFLDSFASLAIQGHGCCIRYKYGLFKQRIVDGFQAELPDYWLSDGNPWETRKPDKAVDVRFYGTVRVEHYYGRMIFIHENYEEVRAVPYDIPIAGYGNNIANTLRLWSAEAAKQDFDLPTFNRGDYLKAVEYKYAVESITQILYPDDDKEQGKLLRLKQQYFLVAAGLRSIINHHLKKMYSLQDIPEKIAIHINDTHPALCVPEMMRILIDEEGMGWDEAWDLTTRTISYTNHTIMPEALEKWPVEMLKKLLPRIYMIILEINDRFCREAWQRLPGDWRNAEEMSIISNGLIHMAKLAVVGSHAVNGVSRIHSQILQEHLMKNFSYYYPGKFTNKTNGISHRRFLLKANPDLARLITEAIGSDWVTKPHALQNILPFAEDAAFKDLIFKIKLENKKRLARIIKQKYHVDVDLTSIFDIHVKRIHAYKRQLLNVMQILDTYHKLKNDPSLDICPRTFIFGGKAAPGYYLAKKIIKLINSLANQVNNDREINDKLKVIFMENYNVSLAEIVIPAADISQQISTASKEASGTGNMKFMMNGAITIGTMDGANIEILEKVGGDNFIDFGLTAEEVLGYYQKGGYNAYDLYHEDERLKRILNQINRGFAGDSPGEFQDILKHLLDYNDEFFLLKDYDAYARAQAKADTLFRDKTKWYKMAVNNIGHSGFFSSDRTILEYAKDIWQVKIDY